MKRIIITVVTILALSVFTVNGQPGCPGISVGPDITLPCNVPCTTLTATAVQTSGQTSIYTVSSIPFTPPYAFNTGTPILVNQDDVWSSVINLPFSFCFYGNTYNQIIAGSNGVVSFDVSNAGGYCSWSFTASCPSSSLPTNAIFGAYHDIDPAVSGTMYYAILGSYPCRTFVVNWYQVAMFSSSCNYLKATHQIVIYESTNIIEVYLQNKPLCSSWNSGNAVVGIQNAAGSIGVTPPGRNTSQWTATNEAWRFTPSGASAVSIAWYQGGTQIGTGDTITVCPTNQSTTYTAQATYNTCVSTTVVVSDSLVVDLSGGTVSLGPANPTICTGGSIVLTASGSDQYTWTPATGLSSTTDSIVTASPLTTTTYTVTGTTPMCTASNTITVTVNPLPQITVTPPGGNICIGDSITLTASGADTFVWTPDNTLSSGTGSTVIAFPQVPTTYTVTGTDTNMCVNSTSVTVVASPGPTIIINASPDHICPGDTSILTLSGAASNIVWSPPNGLSTTTGSVTHASPAATTTYSVIADNNGCISTTQYTLVVSPVPFVDFTSDVRDGCQGLIVHFTDLTTPAVQNWYWNFGDNIPYGNTSILQNPFHYYADPGSYDVALSVVSVDGCEMTMTYPDYITVYPNPIAEFTVNPEIANELDGLIFFNNVSIGASLWHWNFGDEGSINNDVYTFNPTHVYSDTGTFYITLVAITEHGCTDTTVHHVIIEPNISFYVPNAFTPNADTKNSVFRSYGEGIDLNSFEMRIFDRWGTLLYYTRDMEQGWDGKYLGKLASEGVYSWYINYTDFLYKKHSVKGLVTLIR